MHSPLDRSVHLGYRCFGVDFRSLLQVQSFKYEIMIILFVLIHYDPVNNFSVMSIWVFLGLTNTKLQIKRLSSALPQKSREREPWDKF